MKTRLAAVGIAASGALILAGCGAANETAPAGGSGSTGGAPAVSGTISGAGASTQQAATQAWVAGFQKTNPDATINYDPSGSGAGRTQFIAGGVDWAGSDAYIKGDEATKAAARCGGGVVEVPVYVSPIAVVYNLQGVDNLQLVAVDDREDLRRQDHHLERPGHRRPTTRASTCPPPPSPPCTAATSPAPPRTSPTTCPARPRPTGRHPSPTRGRSRAARPRRAPPASSVR